ncbi:DUF1679 domain-containing protein [Puteibacter caeruleilacunae]|nr:DUF1679 domain-containing protein [Puteibacter caeruleilacunae]
MALNKRFKDTILEKTGATALYEIEVIQNLWSGYGKIVRYGLRGSDYTSVVVKHVRLPKPESHPRGWNTDRSHERKIRSYEVETAWYKQWASACDDTCRIPHCLALDAEGDEVLMVLEDLNTTKYSERRNSVTWNEINACLKWLANFHATYMHQQPKGLWKVGTYWHLDTRPDELKVMDNGPLKQAAHQIDHILSNTPFLTIVHGDAKLANFCFSKDGKEVAAVDFQYVGGGCGMKDVAYFVGSCLYEDDCEELEEQLLNRYFKELRKALTIRNSEIDQDALEANWRELYPVAWTDFHRFLKGWSPGHWKINSYSERLSREVVAQLEQITQ